jgi:hypothetical protein
MSRGQHNTVSRGRGCPRAAGCTYPVFVAMRMCEYGHIITKLCMLQSKRWFHNGHGKYQIYAYDIASTPAVT